MIRPIAILLFIFGHSLLSAGQKIIAFTESGIYDSSFTLYLAPTAVDLQIYYTTNCTPPTLQDSLYSNQVGIFIEDRKADENIFSNIPSVGKNWAPPQGKVAKGAIVWAQAFQNNLPVGEPAIFSYFINIKYSFPIFSLVGKKEDLFSDTSGILVPGVNFDPVTNIPGNAGLRGRDWERPVQLEYIENKKLALRQNIGVRIHGLSSRSLPQKSLRLYARNDYGKKYLDYPFFPNSNTERFKRLILRSPGSDWSDTFFKDEMIHSLVDKSLDMDVQDHRPGIVFINGEYWGIYNLRERQDEYHLSEELNVDDDDINLLETNGNIVEGDNQDYLDLLQFVRSHDLSKTENYEQVKDWVNIQNFIDYHLTELFFANQDWPRNNYKFWQSTEGDQRWRWLFFDCDFCMIFHHDDHLGIFLNNELFEGFNREGEEFAEWSVLLFRALLKNDEFRDRFIAKFFQTTTRLFSTDNLIQTINQFEQIYEPEVGEHIQRWSNPGNYDIWKNNVNDLRDFALQRPPYLINKFQEYIGSPFSIFPNPSSGQFKVSAVLGAEERIALEIININGQQVAKYNSMNIDELNSQTSTMLALTPGHYVVLISYRNIRFPHLLTVF